MKKLVGAFLILAVVASGFANVNSIKAHALADTSNQFSTSGVVETGVNHTLAMKTDGSLWAWGYNSDGELGDGTIIDKYTPVKVMENAQSVSGGDNHTLAIKNDGSLWAWGYNGLGQLGDGTTIDKLAPIKVMDNVKSVSAGAIHTVAIKNDGSLWAWGDNGYGQLGDGTRLENSTPIKVMNNVVSVSAGYSHTLAIKTDGSLWAWGYNYFGQLGDGTRLDKLTPVKVMENVVSVSAGNDYTLAIKTDGSLWVWGYNHGGQLGDGTTINKYTSVKVMENVASVSASTSHTLAIKNDGSLWAWGGNWDGQLGDGTTITKLTPVKVMDNVVSVSAGGYHTLAIKNDGSLWAWGNNDFGQLGDGTTIEKSTPIKVMDKTVLVLGIPTHLSVSIPTATSIKLSWTSVSGANGYEVFRSLSATGTYTWLANAFTTSYTNSGLTTGTTYYYKVKARDTTKVPTVYSAYTSVIAAKPVLVLGIPTNLSVSIPTSTSIKLSWTNVSGANGYEVFRSLSATGTYTWLANAFTTSYTNSGLTTGTTYYYKVKARNTTKVPTVYSAFSSVIAAKPVLVLGVPTNLSVSTPTATSIKLSWTSVSGANGYEVFRSLSATGTYTWLANAFTNSYTNSGLTTGTTYYYKVKARSTTQVPTIYSVYSSVIAAKPVLVLGVPTNLSVSTPTATSIKLSWTNVSGANGYEVFRSLSATGTYTWLANAFTNSYTNSGLTTGTTYYYKVKARNTTKVPTVYSAYTSVISAKPILSY